MTWGEEIDFTQQGFANQQEMSTINGTDCTITFNKGTSNTSPKYFTSGTAIRLYGGNTMTITSTMAITKIVLTFGGSDGSNTITTNVNTYSNNTWTGSASTVVFTVGGTSGNRRLQKIDVTYDSGKQNPQLKWTKGGEEVTSMNYTLLDTFEAPTLSYATGFNASVSYESTNTDVATISTTGVVTIVGSGNATIKASTNGNDNWSTGSAQYTLTVQKRDPNLLWSVEALTVRMNETFIQPTLSSADGFNGTMRYTSSSENVATISSAGDITLVGVGSSTIKAIFDGNNIWRPQTVSYTLTVKPASTHVSAFNEVFYESFDNCAGIGGNDGSWSGNGVASATLTADNDCWTFEKGSGANCCAKFGTGSVIGSAQFTLYLEAGQYSLSFNAAQWGTDGTKLKLQANGATLGTTSFDLLSSQFKTCTTTLDVTTAGNVSITFAGDYAGRRFFLDEVVLNITKVSIPMNADGIRTYASVYGLDFSQVEGLTAYHATGYDKTNLSLTMTAMDVTAPGAGMMLKGAANTTYTVPVATSGSTTTTQYLVGLTEATNVPQMDAEGNTTFILAKVNDVINWYKLREENYTLKANSAYLRLPADAIPQGQNPVVMDFTGVSNGISTATSTTINNESWYTLDGRLLQSKPSTKGIYVNNGRKIVIK